jgi:hypothetical protein
VGVRAARVPHVRRRARARLAALGGLSQCQCVVCVCGCVGVGVCRRCGGDRVCLWFVVVEVVSRGRVGKAFTLACQHRTRSTIPTAYLSLDLFLLSS